MDLLDPTHRRRKVATSEGVTKGTPGFSFCTLDSRAETDMSFLMKTPPVSFVNPKRPTPLTVEPVATISQCLQLRRPELLPLLGSRDTRSN
ncbi:hypothetical protein G6F19_014101 [Rhizopus arrhizus]|nr:hypothetical protein G6F19_014101 [Rhizopus arrhizus]KAG1387320.1 hypothetical protein G6F58_013671 [Rhizopus delemar]